MHADLLDRIEAYLESHEDVRDGAYGIPKPNEAMQLLTDLRYARAYPRPEAARMTECLGHPATYWFDAFTIAEGLRADAERRVQEEKPDAARFRWLLKQPPSVRDAVLSPPIPPEHLESPETWDGFVRAAIDSKCGPQHDAPEPEAKYCPHGLDTRLECDKCDAAQSSSQEKA